MKEASPVSLPQDELVALSSFPGRRKIGPSSLGVGSGLSKARGGYYKLPGLHGGRTDLIDQGAWGKAKAFETEKHLICYQHAPSPTM